MPKTKLSKKDSERILEHGIGVMKGIFAEFSSIYNQLRLKVLSMIAAQLVIVGFIFTGWNLAEVNFSGAVWIIFGMAVLLQVVPLVLMMWILSPVNWLIPGNSEMYNGIDEKYDDYEEYLKKLHKDYAQCIGAVQKPVNRRSVAFSYVLYSLGLSIIILLVLKNGG